jgi:sucrose-phosphate synthase
MFEDRIAKTVVVFGFSFHATSLFCLLQSYKKFILQEIQMRIVMFNIHGLIRGGKLEIGKDADNGGQIRYVYELAFALAKNPAVTAVHVFTRRMEDPSLSKDYAVAVEKLSDKVDIRRVWCGGKKYLPKEQLWQHLDEYVDNAVQHIKSFNIFPDWMHSHYADAAYVARELSSYLNVPYSHTGHSLGRIKKEKMLASGLTLEEANQKYKFEKRIEAEETTLSHGEFVITSSEQEVTTYEKYENFSMAEFQVIPPGIDIEKYYPYYHHMNDDSQRSEEEHKARYMLKQRFDKFLTHPDKPFILALCRPDKKKNIDGLIHAYGTDPELRAMANLAIFAGVRSDIHTMPPGEKEVLTEILLLMDQYDLYGKIAIPKKHDTEWEVPELYRFCARQRGVFVNLALTEPFGLTILEAGATGLPVVATKDGGPLEIVGKCKNGIIVDPLDTAAIQRALKKVIAHQDKWQSFSESGIQKVREHYTWDAHVKSYVDIISHHLDSQKTKMSSRQDPLFRRLKATRKMLVSDIDGTIIMEDRKLESLQELKKILQERGDQFAFAVATGRSLDLVQQVIEEYDLPVPDVIISSVGSHIYYGADRSNLDKGWVNYIQYQWHRERIVNLLSKADCLEMQPEDNQNQAKISYYLKSGFEHITTEDLKPYLGKYFYKANIIVSHQRFVDILPKRASKGRAIRYLAHKWNVPLDEILVAGDSGNDLDMFISGAKGIVVGNHYAELEVLRKYKRIFFSQSPASSGILDGLKNFNWLQQE